MQLEEEKVEAECIHDFIVHVRRNGERITPQPYTSLSPWSDNIYWCMYLHTPTIKYHRRLPSFSSDPEAEKLAKERFPGLPFYFEDHPIKKMVDSKRSTFEMLMNDLYTRFTAEYGIPVARNPSLSVIDIRELKKDDVPKVMSKEDLGFVFDSMHKAQKEKYSF